MAGAVKVNIEALRSVSTAVGAVNTVCQTHTKVIKASFETLFSSAESWSGNDRDKYAKRCEELLANLEEDVKDIEALANDMKGIVTKYETLETLISGIADNKIVY